MGPCLLASAQASVSMRGSSAGCQDDAIFAHILAASDMWPPILRKASPYFHPTTWAVSAFRQLPDCLIHAHPCGYCQIKAPDMRLIDWDFQLMTACLLHKRLGLLWQTLCLRSKKQPISFFVCACGPQLTL